MIEALEGMEELRALDAIVKKLMKADKGLPREEAERKARAMWASYCETHKERDAKRKVVLREEWERALDWEFINLAADYGFDGHAGLFMFTCPLKSLNRLSQVIPTHSPIHIKRPL